MYLLVGLGLEIASVQLEWAGRKISKVKISKVLRLLKWRTLNEGMVVLDTV